MLEEGKEADPARRLRVYLALTVLVVVIAALSFLIVPQGNTLGGCERLVFASSKYTCITGLALSQENASLCSYANGTYADSCYMQVAEKSGNAGTCGSVSNGTSASICFSTIASADGNYALCSRAQAPYSWQCQSGIAVKQGNATLCASISNSTYSAECSSIVMTRYATLTGNAAYCRNVSASNSKNLTNYVIANLTAGGAYSQNSFLLSSLSLLPNTTYTARDYCYISVASKVLNPALCTNVSAGEASTICLEQSGAYSYNSSIVENYTALLAACYQAGAYEQACVQSVTLSHAVSTRNATLCSQLTGSEVVSCYSLLASTYKNATYCNGIGNATLRAGCVSNS